MYKGYTWTDNEVVGLFVLSIASPQDNTKSR